MQTLAVFTSGSCHCATRTRSAPGYEVQRDIVPGHELIAFREELGRIMPSPLAVDPPPIRSAADGKGFYHSGVNDVG